MLRQMAADDAGDTGDERMPGHQCLAPVVSVILMHAFGSCPSAKPCTASVSANLWVWIGERSIPVFSRKRIAAGQTPGEPMQPRIVRFLSCIRPMLEAILRPILMPTIEIRPSWQA